VAESFFSSLKSEQIKKRIYQTRAEAKSEIFDYIEGFYNRVRRHKHLDQLSPHEFERQRQTALSNVSRDLGECQHQRVATGLGLNLSNRHDLIEIFQKILDHFLLSDCSFFG
jgi:hypothetical protein